MAAVLFCRKHLWLVLLLVCASLLMSIIPQDVYGQQQQTIESCTEITQSGTYSIAADISPAQQGDSCIVVRTSNVTIDGNGHTIRGSNRGSDTAGIRVQEVDSRADAGALEGVHIRNVTVVGFTYGIQYYNVSHGSVRNTRAMTNWFGILVEEDSENITVVANYLQGNLDGVYLAESDKNSILHNEFQDNELALRLSRSNSNFINNTQTEATNARIAGGGRDTESMGIAVINSDRNRIYAGTISNTTTGVLVASSNGTFVWGGNLTENYIGVQVENSTATQVSELTISENTRGLHMEESTEMDFENSVIRNSTYTGIYIEASENGYLASNSITSNRGYGIVIDADSESIRVALNSFCTNKPEAILNAPGANSEVQSNLYC